MNRRIALVMLSVIGFALGGCKSSNNAADSLKPGQTRIEFWHYMAGPQAKPLDELITKFEKANPDVKVDVTAFQWNWEFAYPDVKATMKETKTKTTMV